MEKRTKPPTKSAIVSFRVPKAVMDQLNKVTKKRKSTRQEFIEALFLPAFEAELQKSSR